MERVYRGFAHRRAGLSCSPSTRARSRSCARRSPRRSLMLATELLRIARADRRTRDYTLNNLRYALAEFVACFPVYRTYIVDKPSTQDRRYIEWAIAQARRRSRAADTTIYEFLRRVLLNEPAGGRLCGAEGARARLRDQDAAVHRACHRERHRGHRVLSLQPARVAQRRGGRSRASSACRCRASTARAPSAARNRPHTMLATSTHDNKRSEDVRARIDVLSEMPERLAQAAAPVGPGESPQENDSSKASPRPRRTTSICCIRSCSGRFTPETDERPRRPIASASRPTCSRRCAKRRCTRAGSRPTRDYESAVSAFVRALLAPERRNLFLKDLRAHAKTFAWFGMLNSLTMTLLKLTCPGVPDIYQGNETVRS